MNFENLKEKLDKRYFKISEYFNDSFDIFKHLFKKEKKFIAFFLVSYLVLQIILTYINSTKLNISDFTLIFLLLLQIIINSAGIQKVGGLIEISNKKISIFKTIKKSFIVYFYIMGIRVVLAFVNNSMIGILLILFLFFNSLFFVHLVYLRDLDFIQTVKYNFYLCKGNRIRLLVPVIILILFFYFIFLPIKFIFGIVPNTSILSLGFIFKLILTIFSSLFNLILLTMATLIFLNVLYMDLKNLKKEDSVSKKNLENKNDNENNNDDNYKLSE